MAILGQRPKYILYTGPGANIGLLINSQAVGDLVGCFEPDTPDIVSQAIRVFRDDMDGLILVRLVDPESASRADLVAVKENHDFPYRRPA